MALSEENKKFLKTMLVLAIPIILQEFINSFINALDSFMVGKLGLNAINAVGLSNQIFFLFILIVFGVNSGSSIFMGQFWGKGDRKSIHRVMGICMRLNFLTAFVFWAAAFFIPEKLISIYSKEPEVIELGVSYLRVVSFSYFFTAISAALNASLKSTRQTAIPMAVSVVALLCNACFNYIFIFVTGWGVAGAALATLIARVFELVTQILIIRGYRLPIGTKIKNYFAKADDQKQFLKQYFAVTLPVIVNEFIWALGTTTYNIAYKFCGNEAQGAVQIANSVQNLFFVMGIGIGSACGIMLSNLLGAGEKEKAIAYSRKFLVAGTGISVVMGICLAFTAPFILTIYNVDANVKADALKILYFIAFGLAIKTYNFITIVSILRSGGDTMFCLIVDAGAVWLIGVPMAFLGAAILHLPVVYVYMMVYAEEVFKCVVTTIQVFKNKWADSIV